MSAQLPRGAVCSRRHFTFEAAAVHRLEYAEAARLALLHLPVPDRAFVDGHAMAFTQPIDESAGIARYVFVTLPEHDDTKAVRQLVAGLAGIARLALGPGERVGVLVR